MKIEVIPDVPKILTPKNGYVYRHKRRGGFWLGVCHPNIASNAVCLVSMHGFEGWWCSGGIGGFGASDGSDFEEIGKLTVEN